MSVCPVIDSTPGSARVLRSVSLKPVGSEGVQRENNFYEKWPVVKLLNKNVMSLMLFYGKI